ATVLDDRADVAIADGTAPFTGRFRPDEPLATFAGLDLAGTWQLSVTDGFAGDEGTLNGWSLEALTDVPLVQYASQVVDFTSQYGPSGWWGGQALGGPAPFAYGDRATAWAAAEPNGGPETLTLGYAAPVFAAGVTVRETWGNGFIRRVDLRDEAGQYHTVWQ